MAELEEIGELTDEVDGGIEEEGEEADKETKEEVEAARESVSTLRNVVDELKELLTGPTMKKIALFVGKNVAIGVILYGVTVVLKKMEGAKGTGNRQAQKQHQKISALSGIVKDMSEISTILLKWLKSKEETTVDVGDGITVPLPDVFYKFTVKMNDVSSVKTLSLCIFIFV